MHFTQIAVVVLHASTAVFAAPKSKPKQLQLSDIFEVVSGNKPSSCDKYYDPTAKPGKSQKVLNIWWDNIGKFAAAGKNAVGINYETNLEKRKLVESYFGIKPGAAKGKSAKPPKDGLEGEAFKELQDWSNKMYTYVTTAQSGGTRPLLACSTEFLQFQKINDPWKDPPDIKDKDKGKLTLEQVLKKVGHQYSDFWIWWNSIDNNYVIEWRSHKDAEETSPKYRPGDVNDDQYTRAQMHYSMYHQGMSAVTFPASPPMTKKDSDWEIQIFRKRPLVILTPLAFQLNAPNTYPPHSRHDVDLKKHPAGTSLMSMDTTALTLYHEMFHLVFEQPQGAVQSIDTTDIPRVGAKTIPGQGMVLGFPDTERSFQIRKLPAIGPVQVMYVGLYVKADIPNMKSLDSWDTINNPESYAWFGLTNVLHDFDQMDWHTCTAQKPGGPFTGPFINRKNYAKDKYVPIDTTGRDSIKSTPEGSEGEEELGGDSDGAYDSGGEGPSDPGVVPGLPPDEDIYGPDK